MTKTILVADDSVTIRKVVELTFHDTEIHVESAGTGREALERIEACRPDLVLADVIMPAPSGYELCRTVKRSHRPVPVLLLAGTFEPFDAERARACGADGCVVKPFESRALFERVSALLSGTPSDAGPEEIRPLPSGEVEAILDDLVAREGPPRLPADSAPAMSPAPVEPLDWLLTAEELASIDVPPPDVTASGPSSASSVEEPGPGAVPMEQAKPADAIRLSSADLDLLARAVAQRLTEKVVREIAWEVVPDLAESIIRERIRQLEQADPEKA